MAGLKVLFADALVDCDLNLEPDRPAYELARLGLQRVRPPLNSGGQVIACAGVVDVQTKILPIT